MALPFLPTPGLSTISPLIYDLGSMLIRFVDPFNRSLRLTDNPYLVYPVLRTVLIGS